MPRYKLSPEERAAEKERKENLRNIMKGLDVKNFDDLRDVFKLRLRGQPVASVFLRTILPTKRQIDRPEFFRPDRKCI